MVEAHIEHLKALVRKAEGDLVRAQRDVELTKERIKQARERLARSTRAVPPEDA